MVYSHGGTINTGIDAIWWLKKVEEDGMGIQKIEKVSAAELMEELILMGLRLEEGILEKSFQEHFGKKFSEIFDIKKLQRLEEQKLILIESGCIKITKDKRILSDAIIKKIVEILQ